MVSEEQLVRRSLRGDIQAFEQLVLAYQSKIYSLAYRYMGNEEDAYDMAQECFIKAYRSLGSFKGNSSFKTWLYRVASNVCLDELRRKKRRIVPISIDEPLATREGSEVEKEFEDHSASVDILYEQKEFAEQIQVVLNEMKPEHKTVVVLRDIMEMTYEEIASVLNCSVGTVKSRLSRARSVLRKKLTDRELLP
ncbi:MAG: RNA polymerase sigma factor [Syntrophomonadaceae bacterium]|jgi:RNA polymerase sigma-70 factor (ECF subfamily)